MNWFFTTQIFSQKYCYTLCVWWSNYWSSFFEYVKKNNFLCFLGLFFEFLVNACTIYHEILQCFFLNFKFPVTVTILHKMNICENPTTNLRWTGILTSGGRDTQARQYSVAWGARVWKEAGNVARLADVVCSFWNQNKSAISHQLLQLNMVHVHPTCSVL